MTDARPADAPPAADAASVIAVVAVHVGPGGSVGATGFQCAGGDCSLSVPVGGSVQLSAAAGAGHRFTGWSGSGPCASSTANPLAAAVSASFDCTASFVATVKASAVGGGQLSATSSSPGAMCTGATCTVDTGGSVTLTAPAVDGKRFTGWSGGAGCTGTGATLVLAGIAADVTCTAGYVSRFTVAGAVSGATGNVTAGSPGGSSACTGSSCLVDQGATVTLTAPAIAGFRQTGWTGAGCIGTGAVLTLAPVTAAVTCSATYVERVAVTSTIAGVSGTAPAVTVKSGSSAASCPGDGSCVIDAGAGVTLTAPDLSPGYRFVGWGGGTACVGTNLTLELGTVTASLACVATYVLRVTVTAKVEGPTAKVTFTNTGCGAGSCTVNVDTKVGLIAPAADGWRFTAWTAPCSGGATTSITASTDVTCTARYVQLKDNGQTCSLAVECKNGACADGVCCDTPCDGQCESCVTGTPGTCTAVAGAPVGRPACSGGSGVCAATCDGVTRATCTFPTVECGPQTCSGAAEYVATCSSGTCGAPAMIRDCTTTPNTRRCGATSCAGVVEVTASNVHTFVRMSDGSIWGWGDNYKGVLGPDAPDDVVVRTPTRFPGLTGVAKLTSSPFLWHECAIMNDGRLLCWGDNRYAQLGLGTQDDVSHPTPTAPLLADGVTPLGGIVDASAGTYNTCAILADRSVTCWGRGIAGRLADQDLTDHYVLYAGAKALPGGTTGELIWTGEDHTCIATEADASSPMKCWGPNSSGECGVTPSNDTGGLAVVAAMNDLDATAKHGLALGNYTTCGLISGGYVTCFGNNQGYQLGRGDDGLFYTQVPGPVCATATPDCDFAGTGQPLANVTGVSLGEAHACALAGGEVRCWGDNSNGQMGTGTLGGYVTYAGSGPPLPQTATQVTSGWYHSCALLADRTVACWGRNNLGELGVPATDYDIPSPQYPIW